MNNTLYLIWYLIWRIILIYTHVSPDSLTTNWNIFIVAAKQPREPDAGNDFEVHPSPCGSPASLYHHGGRHRLRLSLCWPVGACWPAGNISSFWFFLISADSPPKLRTSTGLRTRLRNSTVTTPTGEGPPVFCLLLTGSHWRQFKWFNPRGVDYSNISDKRGAPNYKDWGTEGTGLWSL